MYCQNCSIMAPTAALSLLTLLALQAAAQDVTYFEIGGNLDLNPAFSGEITNFIWKHKGNLVAEYIKGSVPLEYLGDLKGRTNVDLTTGVLTISNMSQSDGGLFTVEINNRVLPVSFKAVGIRKLDGYPVEVSVRPKGCSSLTSKNCTLVCGGQFQGAEPVQYFWKTGKTEQWKEGNKTFSISRRFSDYTCKVKNPISEKQSKPFQSSSGPVPLPAILLVAVLAIGATFVV
ncbi:PREDICTED: T-lymphocyte surface antigen Ly-9-like isoform X1 [Poecilia mexicana]|uniref:T-lymphocyte surface antigen Ly-9-like isoform X1 n=1 Tax=Poecilia mexicana TaxID=48701 RepID=UPI00072E12E1|nr:PREDICTED: T-lymphocyte surface antigen Ly-9-like isoform X1 [Poecilia mexicana]